MKEHIELKKVVVAVLITHSRDYPTASQLYGELRHNTPQITKKYEFKSFVKLINCFPEVQPIKECKGKAMIYKAKI